MINKTLAAYNELSQREQRLVSAASICALIAFCYFVIWAPLNTSLAKQQNALANEQSLLLWVEEQATKASQLRQSSQGAVYKGSLTQLVNQSTRAAKISVSRMQPQGDNLQVSMDEVAFDDLIEWLASLEAKGVSILQSDITEADNAGFVQVRRLQLSLVGS